MKNSLVYIAGYVLRNQEHNTTMNAETKFDHESFGSYNDVLYRGGLSLPKDYIWQWVAFCYISSKLAKHGESRTSLMRVSSIISELYAFNTNVENSRSLSGIFIKNFCRIETAASKKESGQKLLKLCK